MGRKLIVVDIIVILLIILTAILLFPIIDKSINRDANVIAIFPGDKGEGQAPELTPVPGTLPEDEQWESDNTLDLFLTRYTDDDGNVIAESKNEDKIIAPGLSNIYTFSLKNTGDISMDFTMTFDGVFTLLDMGLPIEVRLRRGSEWLVGDDNTWCSPERLQELEVSGTLDYEKYMVFTLEWRWPFENGNDELDVMLSQINNSLDSEEQDEESTVTFALNINTRSTITEGAVSKTQSTYERFIDWISPWYIYVLIAIAALIATYISARIIFKDRED